MSYISTIDQLQFITSIKNIPGETKEDYESRKLLTALVFAGFMMIAVIAVIFFYFDATQAAWVEVTYGYFAITSWAYLRWIGLHYRAIFLAHNIAVVLFPFTTSMAFGGFYESGSRPIWSLLGPIAILVFYKGRFAWASFSAYLVILIMSFSDLHFVEQVPQLPQNVLNALSIANIGGLSAFIFVLFNTYIRNLWREQDKTESLLLNILPKEIAFNLKDHRASELIAQHHRSASILFADIVNFTSISKNLTANELVTLLNQVFCHFDQLTEDFELEKIKTIGDSYMLASGVPTHRHDHAVVLCKVAIAMREYVENTTFVKGTQVRLRIGIHSGGVVAGVIGIKKFVYDLWGNTVNIASRVESHGIQGSINITQSTYEMVKEYFVCESRGMINLKGLGSHNLYILHHENTMKETSLKKT